jgi:hypothetical protein
LVRRLLEELGDIYAVDVITDLDIVGFYERLGLNGATSVARRDYTMQSGRLSSQA